MFEARSAIIIRRVLVFLVIGVAIGIVTARAFDPAREARFEMLERHHAHLQTSNQKLEQENKRLDAELRGLETTDRGWEAVARGEDTDDTQWRAMQALVGGIMPVWQKADGSAAAARQGAA